MQWTAPTPTVGGGGGGYSLLGLRVTRMQLRRLFVDVIFSTTYAPRGFGEVLPRSLDRALHHKVGAQHVLSPALRRNAQFSEKGDVNKKIPPWAEVSADCAEEIRSCTLLFIYSWCGLYSGKYRTTSPPLIYHSCSSKTPVICNMPRHIHAYVKIREARVQVKNK